MKRFNIGIEITDAAAMRALAVQRHLAQGHGEADFTAAETVLWRLTVIADSIGAGRGFRFVSDPLMRPASMDVELITKPSPSCAPIDPDQAGPRIAGSPTSRKIVDGPDIQGAAHQRCAVGLEDTLNNLRRSWRCGCDGRLHQRRADRMVAPARRELTPVTYIKKPEPEVRSSCKRVWFTVDRHRYWKCRK
jgi:hypothetical protein